MDDLLDQPTKKEHHHGGAIHRVQRHGEPMRKGPTKGGVAGFGVDYMYIT
jgi:hypothetical protein